MHSVNPDLLQTTPYRADGSSRDPHAHHLADLRALQRAARRAWWSALRARLAIRWRSSMTSSLLAGPRDEKPKAHEEPPLTPLRP